MIYRTELELVIRADTRFVERQFIWSGKGVKGRPEVRAELGSREGTPGSLLYPRLHGPTWTEDGVDAFLIDLSRTVRAGEILKLTIIQRMVDEAGTFKPFLAQRIRRSGVQLELQVLFREDPAECDVIVEVGGQASPPMALKVHPGGIRDFPFAYSYQPNPAVIGVHRILWSGNRRSTMEREGG